MSLQCGIEIVEVYFNKHIHTWIHDFGARTSLPTLPLQRAPTCATQARAEDSERFANAKCGVRS